jgi:hypothetical protein
VEDPVCDPVLLVSLWVELPTDPVALVLPVPLMLPLVLADPLTPPVEGVVLEELLLEGAVLEELLLEGEVLEDPVCEFVDPAPCENVSFEVD